MRPETRICVIYDPKLPNEATSTSKCIRVGEKFYKLTKPQRDFTLTHELGHDLEWKTTENLINKPEFDKQVFQYNPSKGLGNVSEVFAETFAVYVHDDVHDEKELLTKYPEIHAIHKNLDNKYTPHYNFARKVAKGLVELNKSKDIARGG